MKKYEESNVIEMLDKKIENRIQELNEELENLGVNIIRNKVIDRVKSTMDDLTSNELDFLEYKNENEMSEIKSKCSLLRKECDRLQIIRTNLK